jgi:hypothetical protein
MKVRTKQIPEALRSPTPKRQAYQDVSYDVVKSDGTCRSVARVIRS